MGDERHDEQTPLEHPPVPPGRPSGPPPGPRDPGDAWAYGPDGRKAWGLFGAAGLLVDDGAGRVLLQHRVEWSHYGGTWGIPGGARHQHEDAVRGALRESAEEAGVPAAALHVRATSVLDLDFWTYTTVLATATRPFEPVLGDRESLALEWVPVGAVDALPLHPGFGSSWPALRQALDVRPTIIVDAANVVGSEPDGWWRDRAGAAARLLAGVQAIAHEGTPASMLGLPFAHWWPRWNVVLEGAARAADDPSGRGAEHAMSASSAAVEVTIAPGSGDDAIVETTRRAIEIGAAPAYVVTADRQLRDRVSALGAETIGPRWLRERLP
ncbi:NUDIX domain-containing protein [Curtobacterium ammoniigenes]|uniref:NUDIX domain-containing protein n=1 Tax=Curtobacterium ammoniigenes TaxID=395387 RepID=UPI0008306E09|nr:NUDIX domain-containing protein [Curtobacterium ammoniigenes]